jgi:hypothetical protein
LSDVDTNATPSVASTPVAAGSPAESPATTTGPADTAASGQPEGEGDKQPQPTRDRRAEKRIASLTRKYEETLTEVGRLRGMLETRTPPAAQATEPNAKPQPSQYKSYDDYVEALTDWKTDQKLQAREAEHQTKARTQAETSKATERDQALADRLMSDGRDVEDFEDVMQTITAPGFPISAAMRDYLEDAERPALVAQWLSENPDRARLFYGMNSAKATRELDKVAATLAKPVQVSKAPPPGPTVGGRTVVSSSPEDQSMEEYANDWKARRAKRR